MAYDHKKILPLLCYQNNDRAASAPEENSPGRREVSSVIFPIFIRVFPIFVSRTETIAKLKENAEQYNYEPVGTWIGPIHYVSVVKPEDIQVR